MATEYALYIETDLNPEQVLELMFAGIGIKADIKRLNKSAVFLSTSGPGFTTYASETGSERRSFLMEELSIESSLSILFRLDKFKDLEVQKNVLLRATIELLRQVPGNAALLFNGEVVWLLRKNGELTLNSGIPLWKPDYLVPVTLPYKMKDLPML